MQNEKVGNEGCVEAELSACCTYAQFVINVALSAVDERIAIFSSAIGGSSRNSNN
jgi:hypothetical protein